MWLLIHNESTKVKIINTEMLNVRLTVSQFKQRVSLVSMPWNISCTHVGSCCGLGESPSPTLLLLCGLSAAKHQQYIIKIDWEICEKDLAWQCGFAVVYRGYFMCSF